MNKEILLYIISCTALDP